MNYFTQTILAMAIFLAMATGSMQAKEIQVPKMYVFGFAASFTDTIVHFTDIQEIDTPWIDKKKGFLLNRDQYSVQLRSFLNNNQQLPHRTCVIMFNQNRSKAEKEFLKMKRLYTQSKDGKQHFDVRYINASEFHFKTVHYIPSDGEGNVVVVRKNAPHSGVKKNKIPKSLGRMAREKQEADLRAADRREKAGKELKGEK